MNTQQHGKLDKKQWENLDPKEGKGSIWETELTFIRNNEKSEVKLNTKHQRCSTVRQQEATTETHKKK